MDYFMQCIMDVGGIVNLNFRDKIKSMHTV